MAKQDLSSARWDLIREVNVDKVLETANTALADHRKSQWGITDTPEIKEICIVGSILTSEFEPFESDLDVYFICDQKYRETNDFCLTLTDETEEWKTKLTELLPNEIAYLDPMWLVTESYIKESIHKPFAQIK